MLIVESPDTPERIVEAVRAGAKEYIRKPLSEAEIEKRDPERGAKKIG